MKKIKRIFNKGKKNKKTEELNIPESNTSQTNSLEEELAETSDEINFNDKIKNFLLIGRSGNGKSTLANVITKSNKFKESEKGVSETKIVQSEEFEEKGVKYLIIDTPGIGDTKLKQNEVLDIIAEAVYLVRDGVNQVFFVSGNRFDQDEMATYNLLRTIIFDKDITKHTTIVRTRFINFRNEKECKSDIDLMTKKSDKLAEVIASCQERIIHVDNPSIDVGDEDESKVSKYTRGKSRDKILGHLKKTCQEIYNPPKLQDLSKEITEDMDKLLQSRKELEEEMTKLKTSSVSSTNSPFLKATNITKHSASSSKPNTDKESSEIPEFTAEDYDSITTIAIGKIKELEDKKIKLKKEIKEKERIIRQKVLKHILNNYKEISSELGSDIFMESVVGDHKWENISPEFKDKGLVLKWLNEKFDYEEVQKWATALGNSFKPKSDTGFCAWLRYDKKLTVEKIKLLVHVSDIEQLREEYYLKLEGEVNILDKHKQQLGQLKDVDITQYFQSEFSKWSSGNEEIDKFIQQYQLNAKNYSQILEWISYEKFANIEYLTKGGFATIYKATWLDGPISSWNDGEKKWERNGESDVCLKSLNSSTVSDVFLLEISIHKLVESSEVVSMYGITKEPTENEYMMVMQYVGRGNLREVLNHYYKSLDFEDKTYYLYTIALGLEKIHKQGIIHKNIHSGNIVFDDEKCYIIDFGISQHVSESSSEEKIYGIIPYMAPETLMRGEYTQASDIYSFGMIMLEVLTSYPSYHNIPHNENLVMDICKGLKPEIKCEVPQFLKEIMEKCWNFEPLNRPTARELATQFRSSYENYSNSELEKQVREIEELNRNFIPYDPSKITYTSPPLSPKIEGSRIERRDSWQLDLEIPDIIESDEEQLKNQIQIPPK